MCFVFFFFFQAEDGIRDIGVTGVQTCALPISVGDHGPRRARRATGRPLAEAQGVTDEASLTLFQQQEANRRRTTRSEERRVGKECRSRWSTDHKKKTSKDEQEKRCTYN